MCLHRADCSVDKRMPIELSSNFLLMKSGNGISLHASYGEKKKTVDVYFPELNTKYTKAPEHGTDSVPDYIVDTGMNCTAENAIACKKSGYTTDYTVDHYVLEYFTNKYNHRDDFFANGREVRNFFERAAVNQANRLAIAYGISGDDIAMLTLEDVEQA